MDWNLSSLFDFSLSSPDSIGVLVFGLFILSAMIAGYVFERIRQHRDDRRWRKENEVRTAREYGDIIEELMGKLDKSLLNSGALLKMLEKREGIHASMGQPKPGESTYYSLRHTFVEPDTKTLRRESRKRNVAAKKRTASKRRKP